MSYSLVVEAINAHVYATAFFFMLLALYPKSRNYSQRYLDISNLGLLILAFLLLVSEWKFALDCRDAQKLGLQQASINGLDSTN